jgi:hypothetical protein
MQNTPFIKLVTFGTMPNPFRKPSSRSQNACIQNSLTYRFCLYVYDAFSVHLALHQRLHPHPRKHMQSWSPYTPTKTPSAPDWSPYRPSVYHWLALAPRILAWTATYDMIFLRNTVFCSGLACESGNDWSKRAASSHAWARG